MRPKRTFLILTQIYPPDPTSVGQHIADVALEMTRRGHHVRVITADRGYDDSSVRYTRREVSGGVEIRRVRWSSFGKKSLPIRAAAMVIFMGQCLLAGLVTRRLGGVLVSTGPPMIGLIGAAIRIARGVPYLYWMMDLNPDQLVALGKTAPDSLLVKVSNAVQRSILKRASCVVALDRYMGERLNHKLDISDKLEIIPPWPHEEALDSIDHLDNPFRAQHKLGGKFVFMFSGNHGYSTAVETILGAARSLADDSRAVFLFVGGGVKKKLVDEMIEREKPTNIMSLPYQPLEKLRYSLSSADVHFVSMEEATIGINHPCKIYGALAVGRPVLLLGPERCHATDVLGRADVGWRVGFHDAEAMAEQVRTILKMKPARLREMGENARGLIHETYSKESLCGRFCDLTESMMTIAAPDKG